MDHEIIRDHSTNRPRGFGFIVFDSEQVVEDLLSQGNMIDLAGSQVSDVHYLQKEFCDNFFGLVSSCNSSYILVLHFLCIRKELKAVTRI